MAYEKNTVGDGNIFEGDFADGSPHGKGKMTNADGNVLEGYFFKGKYAGKNEEDMKNVKEESSDNDDLGFE